MRKGYLALVLHAHLPFVRHPEYPEFLEEDWLFEAITETYVPLWQVFEGLVRDGVPFRLTQYRGKVVVLTFWATWCGPCMAMVPHERTLVERFEGKPFALLGINGDLDRDTAKRAVRERQINWRSWWNAGAKNEPISKTWNVRGWPTGYVIDHKGIIRYKNLTGRELEEAVARLLQEAETSTKDE